MPPNNNNNQDAAEDEDEDQPGRAKAKRKPIRAAVDACSIYLMTVSIGLHSRTRVRAADATTSADTSGFTIGRVESYRAPVVTLTGTRAEIARVEVSLRACGERYSLCCVSTTELA